MFCFELITIYGNANNNNPILRPKYLLSIDDTIFPHIPPKLMIATNHDTCSVVIGPNIESSDKIINIVGDSQPTPQPCERVIIFTKIQY